MNCRHCCASLETTFLDLGFAPPSNAYLSKDALSRPETYYPLRLKVCSNCWLVQTEDHAQAGDLFDQDYAYFSSTSSSWLAHAAAYSEMVTRRFGLDKSSLVLEIASNDGYLLKNFIANGVSCLGVEPTESTATAAEKLGIPVLRRFFGKSLGDELAASGKRADLIVGNNVYAHVPDINDFTRGLQAALKPQGVITLEYPHVLRLLEQTQFDTAYHEHFSYLSLYAVDRIFRTVGLRVWDVEEIPTHGGSLRVYGCHAHAGHATTSAVSAMLEIEGQRGLRTLETYLNFQSRADRIKDDLVTFLIEQKRLNRKVAAYGAAAKGNTILNYAGIKTDLLPVVYDAAAAKQGKYMPGSHIPIMPPEMLIAQRPDFLLILPWNIAVEVKHQNADLAALGTKFVTAVPRLEIA